MSEPLTERERKLIDGFVWLRNVTHENHHRSETGGPPNKCSRVSCSYATQIIEKAKTC